MNLPTAVGRAGFALCASMLAWGSHASLAAQIGGSIRFGDEHFSVEVRTTGESLSLITRGCNNFDLAVAAAKRGSRLLLHSAKGTQLGAVGDGKFIEVRTCGAERYITELALGAPRTTKWVPEADAAPGGRRIRYTASLAPTELRFDPPIDVAIFDGNTKTRRIKVSGVAKIATQGEPAVLYSSGALHFLTAGGTIHREGGFTAADQFSLASGSEFLAPPAVGQGSEITFDAPADQPTGFSLYHPTDGSHVLAFSADAGQRDPTSVSTFRVDGRSLLTPEFSVVRVEPVVVERGFFHFLSPQAQLATGSFELRLGSAGVEVREVRIASADGRLLELSEDPSGPYSPTLTYASVPGSVPLELLLRARVPKTCEPGGRTIAVTVTSEGELHREIPVTINVVDPHRMTRAVLLASLGAILSALLIWTFLKRQTTKSREADTRVVFFHQHEEEYAEIRERIEVLLTSEPEWREAEELLTQFAEKRLQTVLTLQQWSAIDELSKQQKSREVLEALDRALARFES